MDTPRRFWPRPVVFGAAFSAIVMAIALAPHAALAHARYKSSTPGKAEVIAAAPASVEITFTQNVQKVSGTYGITVNRDRGADVTGGPATLDDTDRSKMSVALQANLSPGRYVVNWHNVSDDDGDPAEGAFSFYVNVQPTSVDLANDQQLEQIGAEEETPGAGSPTAGGSPAATARPGPTSTSVSATASATPASSSSDSGGSNSGLIIGIVVAVAIVLIAGGGWFIFMRNRP